MYSGAIYIVIGSFFRQNIEVFSTCSLFSEVKESPEKALKKHMAGGPSGSNHQPFPQPKSLQQTTKVNTSIPVSMQGGKSNVAISQV